MQSNTQLYGGKRQKKEMVIATEERLYTENEALQMLWKFVSGVISFREFEHWLYDNSTLESLLGKDFYLEVISTDFSPTSGQLPSLMKKLKEFLSANYPLDCDCILLRHINLFDADSDYDNPSPAESFLSSLETARKPSQDHWWLSLELCKKCGQYWLLAQDDFKNDIYLCKRMSKQEAEDTFQTNEWPSDFGSLEQLLMAGNHLNKPVYYSDPLNNSHLANMVKKLKAARPSITEDEVASLLHLQKKWVVKLLG